MDWDAYQRSKLGDRNLSAAGDAHWSSVPVTTRNRCTGHQGDTQCEGQAGHIGLHAAHTPTGTMAWSGGSCDSPCPLDARVRCGREAGHSGVCRSGPHRWDDDEMLCAVEGCRRGCVCRDGAWTPTCEKHVGVMPVRCSRRHGDSQCEGVEGHDGLHHAYHPTNRNTWSDYGVLCGMDGCKGECVRNPDRELTPWCEAHQAHVLADALLRQLEARPDVLAEVLGTAWFLERVVTAALREER